MYSRFADNGLFDFVTDGWHNVFMAHPSGWALIVASGEAALGICLVCGKRTAKWGYLGVITFHLALMLFGWGFWAWSVPALGLICWLAWADWPNLSADPVATRTGRGLRPGSTTNM